MSTNSSGNTLEGVTEVVVDGNGEPEGNTLEGVTEDVGGPTTISKVIRVTAEDFKTPCRGN
jgi:hypothetical protein